MGVGEALTAATGVACLLGGLCLARAALAALGQLGHAPRGAAPSSPQPGQPDAAPDWRWLVGAGARSPLLGLALGLAGTFLLQSSSAFVALLVAVVDAGVIRLGQAVPVVLGANLGSTLLSQMLALLAGQAWQAAAGKTLVAGGIVLLLASAASARGRSLAVAGRERPAWGFSFWAWTS